MSGAVSSQGDFELGKLLCRGQDAGERRLACLDLSSMLILLQASTALFSIQYATGSVVGVSATDTFVLGGITLPAQAFGAVQQAAPQLAQSSCDGIFVRTPPAVASVLSKAQCSDVTNCLIYNMCCWSKSGSDRQVENQTWLI